MDSTQDSAPIACQCLQCTDRQSPTRNGRGTPSGGLFPGTTTIATGTAGGRQKGGLTLVSLPLPTLLGSGRGQLLRPRHHEGGATAVSRKGQRRGCFDQPRRRFPGNIRWMQSLLDKHVIRSRTHLVQSRLEQGSGKKTG